MNDNQPCTSCAHMRPMPPVPGAPLDGSQPIGRCHEGPPHRTVFVALGPAGPTPVETADFPLVRRDTSCSRWAGKIAFSTGPAP